MLRFEYKYEAEIEYHTGWGGVIQQSERPHIHLSIKQPLLKCIFIGFENYSESLYYDSKENEVKFSGRCYHDACHDDAYYGENFH